MTGLIYERKDRALESFQPSVKIGQSLKIRFSVGLSSMIHPPSPHVRLPAYMKLVPRNATRVALIGPGFEQLSAVYERYNPGCLQAGFSSFEDFFTATGKNSEITEPKFDCILLLQFDSDGSQLKQKFAALKPYLAEGGTLVAELPNPFYFLNLPTADAGAHPMGVSQLQELKKQLQVISKEALVAFKAAGFHFDQLLKHMTPGKAFDAWQQSWGLHTLHNSEIWSALKPLLSAQSFLYRVTARPVPRIRFQAQMLKPIGGVNDVRIQEPLEALATIPGVSFTASQRERVVPTSSPENRIFLWHRPILTTDKSLKDIQTLRRAGYVIITEFDDHHSPWPAIEENQFLSFAGVHAVQTTTPVLADMLRKFNPEVGVFQNQLNYLPARNLNKVQEETRIFFGALNREEDWRPIMGPLNKALKAVQNPYFFDVVFDQAFFDALETDNKRFTPQCPYHVYKSRLSHADISLMPLSRNGFNEMKSDLKLVEAAGFGAVPVASSVVYGKIDHHREFSILCEQPDDFGRAVADLIDNPERRLSLQQKARDYVKTSRLLCHYLDSRYIWYLKLVRDREKLDRELELRLQKISR